MYTDAIKEDLESLADAMQAWDREDVYKMYEWLLKAEELRKSLNDDAFFASVMLAKDLPTGTSPAPENREHVWTWDNHGRYLIGEHWTADDLKIRRLDELRIK